MPQRIRSTDLVYFPVPKIACTSIKHAILAHNDPDLAARIPAPVPIRVGWRRMARHVHEIYPSRTFQLRYRMQYAAGRWFTIVRDPLKRFLSSYSNRILHHDDLKHADPAALDVAGLRRQPDLDEFVGRLDDYNRFSKRLHHHVRPLCDYLGARPGRYDRIFSMRQIGEIEGYCAEAGAPLALPHMQTGGPKLALSDLSSKSAAVLKRYYAEDYRIWGEHLDG